MITIEDYENEDKARALINNLSLNIKTDSLNENGNCFNVNETKIKRGDSPQDLITTIELFKTLLTKKDIEQITAFIRLNNVSKETRDCLYNSIEKKLDKKKKAIHQKSTYQIFLHISYS